MTDFDSMVAEATEDLLYEHDGPVTDFVIMARAVRAARSGKFPKVGVNDPVAEALYNVMAERHGVTS